MSRFEASFKNIQNLTDPKLLTGTVCACIFYLYILSVNVYIPILNHFRNHVLVALYFTVCVFTVYFPLSTV